MTDTTRIDAHLDEEVERALAAYASARLTPDRFTTNRMRVALIVPVRTGATRQPALGRLGRLSLGVRRLAFVALVAALAISGGTAAGVAASAGGPLYGLRVQIETALLPSGPNRTDAQIDLLNERSNELTDAIKDGDQGGAGAAAAAYGKQLQQTVDDAVSDPGDDSPGGPTAAQIAAQRADLLILQAALERQLAHLKTITKPSDPSAANLQANIAKTQAALDAVNAKLASLPAP